MQQCFVKLLLIEIETDLLICYRTIDTIIGSLEILTDFLMCTHAYYISFTTEILETKYDWCKTTSNFHIKLICLGRSTSTNLHCDWRAPIYSKLF